MVPVEQVLSRGGKLTVADVVDIALRSNPATRAAWADARAAAANYRSSKGAWLPTVNLSGSATRSKSGSPPDRSEAPVTNYNATASLSYLLLDFGGRSASVEEARQAFLAEEWTRNAVMQNTVLQVEVAFFSYAGARAMLEANRTSLAEAEANLAAAEERQRVGLATSADVLQAKTAYSEVKLAVVGSEGQVRIARASLAVSMGYPANVSQDLDVSAPEVPDSELSATVDELIDRALAGRPELRASRAASRESGARVTQAWSRMLPSLSVSGSIGRAWPRGEPDFSESYSGTLQVQIPIFTGFSQQFDLFRARAQAEADRERTRSVEQTTVFQVFSAHSDFLTAGERLKATDDLVASAQQSEEVALGRYKEGVGSILDLLSAQRALAMARAEQINAQLSWFIVLAQLAHDVGVLELDGDNPLVPGAFVPR
jgi:TolC family type I secretion outer membrane protein